MTLFGDLLDAYRHRAGLSQSKLATRAGFDHSYVSRLASGGRLPTRETVDRLAAALGLSDADRDALLASANFLPRDVSSLLVGEPAIGEVLDLLRDQTVSEGQKARVRQLVGLAVAMARG